MLGREPAPPPSRPPGTIALYPKALDRDGERGVAGPDVLHDAPRDDPEVMAAYARWLDRRHPERRRPAPEAAAISRSAGGRPRAARTE